MNTATLEDNQLLITSQYYSSIRGRYMDTTAIDIADIKSITAKVGPQGGMHTWSVNGKDGELYYGDRKDSELIEQITKLIPKIKYIEKKEKGGAPW